MSNSRKIKSVALVRPVVGDSGKLDGRWYLVLPNGGMPVFPTKIRAIGWAKKNGFFPSQKTVGVSRSGR